MLQPVQEPLNLNRFYKNRVTLSHCAPEAVALYLKRLITSAFRASSKTWVDRKKEACQIVLCVMILMWKWRERMRNLPPFLPPAETEPLGAALGCFGEGREMWWWHVRDDGLLSWAFQLKSPLQRQKSVCSTNSFLQGIWLSGQFPSSRVWKVEEVESRSGEHSQGQVSQRALWEAGWHGGTSVEARREPLGS